MLARIVSMSAARATVPKEMAMAMASVPNVKAPPAPIQPTMRSSSMRHSSTACSTRLSMLTLYGSSPGSHSRL